MDAEVKDLNNVREIKEVCYNYGIVFKTYEIINSGSSNQNFLLKSVENQYMLKRMPKKVYQEDFIVFQNWLSEILKSNNINFGVNEKINDSYVYETEEYYWQLRRYIPNVYCFDFNSVRQMEAAAKFMARVHKIDVDTKKRKLFFFEEWFKRNCKEELEELGVIIERYIARERAKEMINFYSKMICSEYVKSLSEKSFQSCIIHGDFHGGNLLFKGDELISVIDWDTARINPQTYDVAKAIYLLTRKAHGNFENDVRKMKVFLDSYKNDVNISLEELETMSHVLAINYLPKVNYIVSFGNNTKKIQWYLEWTYNAAKMIEQQFVEKLQMII